ncbi:MAG: cytochrome c [Chlamydiota bacterium]|nr:cytochrome c [Chlamydiota bacterium]
MRILKSIFCLALFMLAFTFFVSADDIADIYAKKCKSCHGANGEGNPAFAKMLKVEPGSLVLANSPKSDEELVNLTKDGAGKMPAYQGKLSDEEINGLVQLMRNFGK